MRLGIWVNPARIEKAGRDVSKLTRKDFMNNKKPLWENPKTV